MRMQKALAIVAAGLTMGLSAQAQTLLKVGDQEIKAVDMEADGQVLPANMRHHALSDPLKVEIVGQGLMVRRELARQAREKGLDKSAIAQARLQQAQEAALMELLLEDAFASKDPSDADLLKYAENEYKVNAEHFKLPADERKASHILILGDDDKAKEEIDDLHQQLEKGADFGELAFKFSKDPGSAANYGSLGFFPRGKMVPEFEAELDKLTKNGEYSKPFKTSFGWHIVRLDDSRGAGTIPFEQVRDDLIAQGRAKARKDLRDTMYQQVIEKIEADKEAIEAFAKKNKELADKDRPK